MSPSRRVVDRRPGRPARLRAAVVAVSLSLLTAACARHAPQDTLKPAGPAARSIDHLMAPVFVVAGVIFVIVQGLILLSVFRFRQRGDNEGPEPVQVHGNTRLEITWTVIPSIILAVIAVFTIKTIFDLARKPANPVRVTVTGHQWWWEYNYRDLGVVTANELHIPVGRPIEITLHGVDVIHSFWVPRLAGKTDVVPGRSNHMSLRADRPGTYLGQCTEYCGLSHANMRLRAIAHTRSGFDDWVAAQKQAAATPPDGSPAADGLNLFNAKGCSGCHTVEGVSRGRAGPNLTHVYSRTTFAGSMFSMSPANLRSWLRDPPGEKPGSKMPNLKLSSDEISKLVAYLETLK